MLIAGTRCIPRFLAKHLRNVGFRVITYHSIYLYIHAFHLLLSLKETSLPDILIPSRIFKPMSIKLTAKGKEIHTKLEEKQVPWANQKSSHISEPDLATTLATLKKIPCLFEP